MVSKSLKEQQPPAPLCNLPPPASQPTFGFSRPGSFNFRQPQPDRITITSNRNQGRIAKFSWNRERRRDDEYEARPGTNWIVAPAAVLTETPLQFKVFN